MDRAKALELVVFKLDDALSDHNVRPIPENATLLGWYDSIKRLTCKPEEGYCFVAVFGYGGWTVDLAEAIEIATDYLAEVGFFAERLEEPHAPHITLEA